MAVVKLFAAWPSAYSYRVIWALKLKGIPLYEYIEEDLSNKSPLLLQYNPIHKKIPVLLHDGKVLTRSQNLRTNLPTMAVVTLFGSWFSPYAYRVIWALKLKGIPYEYILEDLPNKSPLLLQYNPIHKKVPVLVHDGKPICESSVILQYIDEIWPQNPLLPADPYDRAVALFWIKFADDKIPVLLHDGKPICESTVILRYIDEIWPQNPLLPADPYERAVADDKCPLISKLYRTDGEEQQAVAKECFEMLEVIEGHALIGGKKFFGEDEINMVDIAFCSVAYWLGVIEDFTGLKIFEPHKFPRLNSWIQNFKSVPVIKDNLPDTDKMPALLKRRREMLLASKSKFELVKLLIYRTNSNWFLLDQYFDWVSVRSNSNIIDFITWRI
ncbi:glutathione transferase GST 23-like [Gossypium australe]|uniref:glutathione transferase n=1 Tax=Gossypium australe TaxID=47621 RepID=A0A5B6WUB7_9ROSI|nr:glutathione transferase GST 23-like [Gossypium australe]